MPGKSRLLKEKALQKIKQFCGYQERCHYEVKQKLYSLGVWKSDIEEIISELIQENYLNEERFAIQFAGGKFRMKQWGKVKISHELKQKQISQYCILKALNSIDDEDYQNTFRKLAFEKWKTLKGGKNIFIKKRKMMDYLIQKGYQSDMVNTLLNSPNQLKEHPSNEENNI
ncbi:MAG TPA: regulatory protein RecX [Puia sp.]|nr:regulatory protein RecX [Puia sp.]